MSKEELSKPNHPPYTRRGKNATRIAVESANRKKRRLLVCGLVGTITAGLGVACYIDSVGLKLPSFNQPPKDDVPNFLNDRDKAIRNLESFARNSVEITALAIELVSRRMNYPPIDPATIQYFLKPEDYIAAQIAHSSCQIPPPSNSHAVHLKGPNTILVSLGEFGNNAETAKKPATALLEILIHEQYHYFAKKVAFEKSDLTAALPTSLQYVDKYGLIVSVRVPILDKEGKICVRGIRIGLEEAVVQSETLATLAENRVRLGAGKDSYDSPGHKHLADRYKNTILLPFFPNNHIELLRLHQASDQIGYLSEVGRRLFPNSQNPIDEADLFFSRFLS